MAGGWAGQLARLWERGGHPERILECHRMMPKDTPLTINCYNYIIGAHLRVGNRQEAYRLLEEMEERNQLTPNMVTFELLLDSFGRSPGLERTVEEMFELMVRKYGLEPSAKCWLARLGCWLKSGERKRFIRLLGEGRRRSVDLREDGDFYTGILRLAVSRGEWQLLEEEVLPRIHPLKLLDAQKQRELLPSALFWQPEARLTAHQWESIWSLPPITASPHSLRLVRYIHWQLEGLFEMDPVSWQRLLLYAGECGQAASDLALMALKALHRTSTPLSTDLLNAFVMASEKPTVILSTGQSIPPFPLTAEHTRILQRVKDLITNHK